MKIKHNIQRYGRTLQGYILDTIFEDGEYRGDEKEHFSKNGNCILKSERKPELLYDKLYVFGDQRVTDGVLVRYTYDTEKEAQEILEYINEFSLETEEEFKEGERVLVKDNEDPKRKNRIYLTTIPGNARDKYVVVRNFDEQRYYDGQDFSICLHKHIKKKNTVQITTDEGKSMEIEKEEAEKLGFKFNS